MLYIDPLIISARGKNQNKVQPIKGTHKTTQSKNQKEDNKNDHIISKGKKQKEFQKMLQEKAKEANKQPSQKPQPRTDTITISKEGRKYMEEHGDR